MVDLLKKQLKINWIVEPNEQQENGMEIVEGS